MNYKQLNYFNNLADDKKKAFVEQRNRIELRFLCSLLDNPDLKPITLDRFDQLFSEKSLKQELILEQLGKFYELDTKLYFKLREIKKQRKELKSFICDLEKDLI